MKTAVVCIARMENHYIREWVEHYKSIGFTNVILYDNNMLSEEHFEDVISDYIDNNFVILKNARGKRCYQCSAYFDAYREYRKQYDWMLFVDADELLDLGEYDSIKHFLNEEKFQNESCIRIAWKIYDDSGLVRPNGDYRMKERFSSFKYCRQCKSIIRTTLDVRGFTPHGPLNIRCVDSSGRICGSKDEFLSNDLRTDNPVWINHYFMKTIEEYVTGKMKRLYPDQKDSNAQNILRVERFFLFNELTDEKKEYLDSIGIELKMKDGQVDYIRSKEFYENWFK